MPDYIKIRTARNVEIEYRVASLGDRILGRIIDSIIWTGYIFVIMFIISYAASPYLGFLLLIPAFFYTFLFERFNDGQTPGKNIMMTRVVSLSGEPVTTGMYLIRWLLLLIDARIASGVIGIISILGSEYGQRLGDIAAGTTVVSLRTRTSMLQSPYQDVPDRYVPIYQVAASLTDRDIQTIKKVLRFRGENRQMLISLTATKLEEILGIQRTASSMTLLKDLIKDYNYYQKMAHRQENYGYGPSAEREDPDNSGTVSW